MNRPILRPVLLMFGLSAVTCWLYFESRNDQHQEYDQLGQLLNGLSRVDSEINAEVLKLEFELRKNYDHLTLLEQHFLDLKSRLSNYSRFAFRSDVAVERQLMEPMERKLKLATDFKALHAVLSNSVAIFRRNCEELGAVLQSKHDQRARFCLVGLENTGMEFVLAASPESRQKFSQSIVELSQLDFNSDSNCMKLRATVSNHAENLLIARPQMDRLLRDLDRLTVPNSLQAMQFNSANVFATTSGLAGYYQQGLLSATFLLIAFCGFSIRQISTYVTTIQTAKEELEERVRERTERLVATSEELRSNSQFLASVLDAIDARICILNSDGTINATNAAWVADQSILNPPQIGENYLRVFSDNSRSVFGSPEVIRGIDRLSHSVDTSFVAEYATSSATERRWIQARLSKMAPKGPGTTPGFVVALIDITERVKTQEEKDKLNRQMQALSRQAGMAEVATRVLHNVGNVLNSINIASSQASKIVHDSRLASLRKAEQLVNEHLEDFPQFVANDPRGKQLPRYISEIAKTWGTEQAQLLNELADLSKHVEHVKHVIKIQQNHAKGSNILQELDLNTVVEDAIATITPALTQHDIELVREFQSLPRFVSDPHKILQVLINLLSNAKHAILDNPSANRRIVVSSCIEHDQAIISVSDSGVGISSENLARICQHGFTTRKEGHGFGLHSCALLAKELRGSLHFTSPGINQGATFALRLPLVGLEETTNQELHHVDCV